MKKYKIILLILCMLLLVSGCKTAQVAVQTPLPSMQATIAETRTPLPTVEPTPTPEPELEYAFNPYVLTIDALAFLDNNDSEYKRLVDAILTRQETVAFDSEDVMKNALSCISEFPLTVMLSEFPEGDKTNTVYLKYRFNSEEHAAYIEEFRSRVTDVILSCVKPQYNELERALSLYRFTAQNIRYVNGDDVSTYNALMNGEGICQSYDGVYRFLLMQIGMECMSAGAFTTEQAAHAWTYVKIDGQWFHMDPTFENSGSAGEGLIYFGMDDERRLDSGMLEPISTGSEQWFKPKGPSCQDTRFSLFENVMNWDLDIDTHCITLYCNTETKSVMLFDTVTYQMIDESLSD